MPWQYGSQDGKVEIIVDPRFRGDILALAHVRPVWIVDTDGNRPAIDASWEVGKDLNLYEVSRIRVDDPDDRIGNLLEILGLLDDHQGVYDFIAHGLEADDSLRRILESEGFRIVEGLPNGFSASRIPGVRERLIGRTE